MRNALVRALRTGAQAAAAVLGGIPVIETLSDIEVIGSAYLVAFVIGANAAIVSFLQNVAEDLGPYDLPK